ncbi:F-box protein SKIP22 [Bienertia sinuspersici]
MKLRLRSLETKQTQKIEVPNNCTLQQLKENVIIQLFSSSSSSSAIQQNLVLSLNRKEELCGSSPEDSIQSLGVTSGDLIYYSQNPYAFSSETPNLSHVQLDNSREISISDDKVANLMNSHEVESGKLDELNNQSVESRDLMDAQIERTSKLGNSADYSEDLGKIQVLESCNDDELIGSSSRIRELMNTQVEGSLEYSVYNEEKSVEGNDEKEVEFETEVKDTYKFFVPSFLKKIFVKEVRDAAANGSDHKLLVIAVHAVLKESGFVVYDPILGRKVDGFHLADEWPCLAFGMTLHYTLPEASTSEGVETVVLKFQSLGKFVNIYGSLPKKGYRVHRLCLDEPQFVPALSFVWKRSDYTGSENVVDGSRKLFPNHEIFEFWKIVKDGISYPLLIDVCEQMGILPPPCLMRLPTELKLKILESLPAIDVARVECVCSELRFVASNNDLWRLKYEEEFGIPAESQRECQWKARFSSSWDIRKKRKRVCMPFRWQEPPQFQPLFPGRRDPNPFGTPFFIGGDYDRLPAFGLPQHPGRRIFRRNCDFGGLGGI